ncbi:MAG: NAD(+) diphosphatase [Caldilineaceae bacterium]|nr:NAD(+) diphosphatase [Caldilineaceae bacterium]
MNLSNARSFIPIATKPDPIEAPAFWFIFQDDRLLVRREGERAEVPLVSGPEQLGLAALRHHYLGYLTNGDGHPTHCYSAEISSDAAVDSTLMCDTLRPLHAHLDELIFQIAGRAIQVVSWDRTHQFCGRCGSPTETAAQERAKVCVQCGLMNFPRLSPAIIIAIVRRDGPQPRLLMARNHRFPEGLYSVIAGFVEPGESLEECAHREVYEEVGVRIKNVRYFASQPWPFPNSLMIGFTADFDGGDFELEEAEIADARWFTADDLPLLPGKISIARRLIDWFVDGCPAGREVDAGR